MFASRLQWLFRTAAAVRAGDTAAAERLVAYLGGVPDESVEPIIRACSLELQLANIAEERERVRRRRQYDATGAVQRESLAETAEILQRNEVDIAPLAAQLQIEHVLTAHPTEATRRSCSTTSGTSPRCWTGSTTRAPATRAGARCWTSCARS